MWQIPGWLREVQLKNGLLYLLAQAIPAFAAIFTLAFFTRFLSADEYGLYSLVVVTATAVNIMLFNWLYVGIYRFWNDGRLSQNDLKAILVFALSVVSVLVLIVAAGVAVWTGQYLFSAAFCGLLLCGALFTAHQRVNAITNQAGQFLWAETFRVVIGSGTGILLVWLGYSWPGVIMGTCLGFIVVLLFSRQFRQLFSIKPHWPDWAVSRQLLAYGLPLSLTFVLLEVIHASDRILLSLILGVDAAGQYAAAISLPQQLLLMLGNAVGLALYPQIIQVLEEKGTKQADLLLSRYLLILLGVLIPAWLGMLAIRHDFIQIVLGEEFVLSGLTLLPWLGLAMVFNALYLFYVSYAFQLSRNTAATVRIVLIAAVLNVILNGVLIPIFGVLGAALATVIAYVVCVFYGFLRGKVLFPMSVDWPAILQILLSAVLMFAVLDILPIAHGWFQGVVRIVLGILIYSLLVLGMNTGNIRQQVYQYYKTL